ncbi:cell division protein SepF [Rhizocola hellebori]|nr:cell division protein SepF [Rhizocola hellebori]
MGALRKAGVWLGLVEDDDDHEYDDAPADTYSRATGRQPRRAEDRSRDRYEDDFDDDEDLEVAITRPRERASSRMAAQTEREVREVRDVREVREAVPRVLTRDVRDPRDGRDGRDTRMNVEARLEQARAERATVRPITTTRPVSAVPSAPTRDNLALAPQTQPLRATPPVVEDDRRTQITTLHPTTYNEARQIGERFRDGSPVIMNLTEMDEADAKRLVDFAAGLAFGLRGTIERVTNRVFLLSPANVQVTAEDKAKIAEGRFLNHS